MPFSLESWKTELGSYFNAQSTHLQPAGVDTLFGWLVIKTLLPAVIAAQLHDSGVTPVITRMLKRKNAAPVLALLQRWPGRPEGELAREIFAAARADAGLRQALDDLLEKLEVIALVRRSLLETDQLRFTETLGAELRILGSRLDIQGEKSSAAGLLGSRPRLPKPNPWVLGLGLTALMLLLTSILGWSSAVRARQAQVEADQLQTLAENNLLAAEAERAQVDARIAELEAAGLETRSQADHVLGRQLGTQARLSLATEPAQIELATLLALEALQRSNLKLDAQVLRDAVSLLPIEGLTKDHLSMPTAVALSSDARYIVTGDSSGSVRVWDLETGHQFLAFRMSSPIKAITISPDNRWIAVSARYQTELVEAGTWSRVLTWDLGEAVAFSPDSRQALGWEFPNSRTLDLETLTWQTGPQLQVDNILDLDIIISANLHWAAIKTENHAGSRIVDLRTRIVDLTTGAVVSELTGFGCPLNFNPAGNVTLSCSGNGYARLWDIATRQEIARLSSTHWDTVAALAFSPDGSRVVSGGGDETVRVWDAKTGQELIVLDHQAGVTAVAFSPDGSRVVSGGQDGSIRVWDLASGREVMRTRHASEIRHLLFIPGGRQLISTASDEVVRVWQLNSDLEVDVDLSTFNNLFADECPAPHVWTGLEDGATVMQLNTDSPVSPATECAEGPGEIGLAFLSPMLGPNGEYLLSKLSQDYAFELRDLSGNQLVEIVYEIVDKWWVLSGEGGLISPDGTWLAIPITRDDFTTHPSRVTSRIGIWTVGTGQEIQLMETDGPVTALTVSPDGGLLAAGTITGQIQVWKIGSPEPLAEIHHEAAVTALDFSPDGQLVVSASNNNSDIKIWEVAGGAVVTEIASQSVNALAFGPDGRYIYAVNGIGAVRVIGVDTGEVVVQFTVPVKKMKALLFSPDGYWLATTNQDGVVQIWDMLTGQEVARQVVTYSGEYTPGLAFNRDGRWIAYLDDNRLKVWLWHPDGLMDLACTRVGRNLTPDEWQLYFPPDVPRRQTCPAMP